MAASDRRRDGDRGTSATGGAVGAGGAAGSTSPGSYALNPPKQCDNQFFVSGCQNGVASSSCGGVCSAANACEDISQKPKADVGFLCPRFALESSEMAQAADRRLRRLAAVQLRHGGHDVDQNGLDGTAKSTCCQCYQLVYSLPENEARVNGNGASAIAIPRPGHRPGVQHLRRRRPELRRLHGRREASASFNACDPAFSSMKSPSGLYLYSSFPEQGEPGSGGVNAATQLAGCKTTENLVTAATLSSATCVANMHERLHVSSPRRR